MMKYQRKLAISALLVFSTVLSAQSSPAAGSPTTIPLWGYSVTSPVDGNTYTGSMVGRSPFFHGARTTSIPVFVVPTIVNMPDGGVFDPTQADSTCLGGNVPLTLFQQSPLLNDQSFSFGPTVVGNTQYVDAFQRGNFWNTNVAVTGDRYHTLLGPITTVSPVTINVPAGEGATYSSSAYGGSSATCGQFGVADTATLNGFIQNNLLPGLASAGVGPTALPIFLMYNVVEGLPGISPTSNCCGLGYHGTIATNMQTFVAADFDSTGLFPGFPPTGNGPFLGTNVASISHQIGAWMDNPLGSNLTPAYGDVGLAGCHNVLNVGEPLTGQLIAPGTANGSTGGLLQSTDGFTYDLQELAFFSWFYRQDPSLGVNGWFSTNDNLTTDAGAVCSSAS